MTFSKGFQTRFFFFRFAQIVKVKHRKAVQKYQLRKKTLALLWGVHFQSSFARPNSWIFHSFNIRKCCSVEKNPPPLRLFFAIIRGASHSQTILVIAPTTEGGRKVGEQRKKRDFFGARDTKTRKP